MPRRAMLVALFGVVATCSVSVITAATEVTVMVSGAFRPAYNNVKEAFEKETGHKLILVGGPSMGATPQAIPNRLSRGETADVVILARSALDSLVEKKLAVAGSQTDLAHSPIAMAVKQGAAKPDISTVEALKKALLNARSIAYSDSASGVYISTQMFKNMGIEQEMRIRAHKVEGTPVGETVAEGKAEIGFQQLSELKAVHGIDIVGLLPEKVQMVTVFSAGIAANSKSPEAGKALIAYLVSPKAYAAIEDSGLEPASKK